MRERLLQGRFTADFRIDQPRDVTPRGFTGLGITYEERAGVIQPQAELGRYVREVAEPIKIAEPYDVAAYLIEQVFHPFEQIEQEELWVLLLDNKNVITHDVFMYRGSAYALHLRVGELFREAVRHNATGIILSHCHPSGDPQPSPQDERVSRQAVEAGKLLDIDVLDSLIIGDRRWRSLKQLGVI